MSGPLFSPVTRQPCLHPAGALFGTFISGECEDDVRLQAACNQCGSAWDQDTIPLDVLARITQRLDSKRNVRDGIDPKVLEG